VTFFATHSQEAVLQAPAAQDLVKLTAYGVWQRPPLIRHLLQERRIVLLHEPVEQRLLGSVALVTVRMHFRLRSTC
jgi:hypothetical protein